MLQELEKQAAILDEEIAKTNETINFLKETIDNLRTFNKIQSKFNKNFKKTINPIHPIFTCRYSDLNN